MKLNFLKRILVCALAGLTIFAVGNADAGTVIGGQLYTPLNLKLTLTYYDGNGNFKKLTVNDKDILLALTYPKNYKLARGPGGDIYVLDKNAVMSDLTAGGFLSMDFNQLLYTQTQQNNSDAFNFSESGILTVNFYSDGGADGSSGHGSAYWFEINGAYTGSGHVSAASNNQQTVSENLKSSALSGNAFDVDVFDVNEANSPSVPATGSVSGNGSGKVLVD